MFALPFVPFLPCMRRLMIVTLPYCIELWSTASPSSHGFLTVFPCFQVGGIGKTRRFPNHGTLAPKRAATATAGQVTVTVHPGRNERGSWSWGILGETDGNREGRREWERKLWTCTPGQSSKKKKRPLGYMLEICHLMSVIMNGRTGTTQLEDR